MRTVLALAYHFPPIGGAGVQRTVKFVRYLPEHGYSTVVVTSPGPSWWTQVDDRLQAEVGPDTRVVRVSPGEPAAPGRWRGRWERWGPGESAFGRWWADGVRRSAGSLVHAADLVYASLPPFETAAAAIAIGARAGRPVILDFRDSWAIDELAVMPTRLHRRAVERRMRAVLGGAAAIVMNTDVARERLLSRWPDLADRPVVTIPNGYDGADFAQPPQSVRQDGVFRIVHTGLFLTELGRRQAATSPARRLVDGAVAGLEILTRSPLYLIGALNRIARADPALASTIELHLAGHLSDADRELAAKSAVRVVAPGYLSHADSVALVRTADLLFLPMHTPPPGVESASMPGKTFEYLASARPILAAVPMGDARDLLARVGGALLVWPNDVAGMAQAIADEVERSRAGHRTPPADPVLVGRYERHRLTRTLAELFDGVLSGAGGAQRRPGAQT